MRVEGTLLKVDFSAGDFKNETGENIAYDNVVLTVYTDDAQIIEVKRKRTELDPASIQGLSNGQRVACEVEVPKGIKLRLNGVEVVKAVRSA